MNVFVLNCEIHKMQFHKNQSGYKRPSEIMWQDVCVKIIELICCFFRSLSSIKFYLIQKITKARRKYKHKTNIERCKSLFHECLLYLYWTHKSKHFVINLYKAMEQGHSSYTNNSVNEIVKIFRESIQLWICPLCGSDLLITINWWFPL